MKNNYKNLLSNIGIFSLANFTSKILTFIILPLYTGYLTTEEYGTIDLLTTSIQLLFPVLTLTISDAVLRYTIDDSTNAKRIFTIGVKITEFGIIPLAIILLIAKLFVNDSLVLFGFASIFVLQAYYNLFGSYTKAINKTKQMALISTLTSFIILLLDVYFIAVLKYGLYGYIYANIIGYLGGDILYIIICKLYTHYRSGYSVINNELTNKMLRYSIPLIPNAVFWWVNSSLDRWSLTLMTGLSYVGIYAAANKIPTIISTFNSIFSQAWNLSLFQSKEGEERASFFKTIYSFFNESMFCITLGLISLTKVLGKLFFLNDFYQACYFVPLLTMGVLYNSLNSFIGSIFTSNKETKYIFTTTAVGAGINCVLNFILVYFLGAIGAAIATLVSYLAVFVLRVNKIRMVYGLRIAYRRSVFQFALLILTTVLATWDRYWTIITCITLIYYIYFGFQLISILREKRSN